MKCFQILVLAVCFSVGLFSDDVNVEIDIDWDSWKAQNEKSYEGDEESMRRAIWEENLAKINKHNNETKGRYKFRLDMNEFGDLTTEEFVSSYNGFQMNSGIIASNSTYLPPSNVQIPESVDWRNEAGYVSKVGDQGMCGSCWAFSATGSLEGQHFKKTGNAVCLSEQNLVDCSGSWGNNGCNGGRMLRAFDYIRENGGINTEARYPYTGQEGSCQFSSASDDVECTGYIDITSGSEEDLMSAIATVGPISVAIDASHYTFQFYKSGVYHEPTCSSSNLDHAVLAVGYDATICGVKYYIIKNSWGTGWGNEGYIWMARNKNNHCGIASNAIYPLV